MGPDLDRLFGVLDNAPGSPMSTCSSLRERSLPASFFQPVTQTPAAAMAPAAPKPVQVDPKTLPLPPDWEMGQTAEGHTYFVCHRTKSTTWQDPRMVPGYVEAYVRSQQLQPLPPLPPPPPQTALPQMPVPHHALLSQRSMPVLHTQPPPSPPQVRSRKRSLLDMRRSSMTSVASMESWHVHPTVPANLDATTTAASSPGTKEEGETRKREKKDPPPPFLLHFFFSFFSFRIL